MLLTGHNSNLSGLKPLMKKGGAVETGGVTTRPHDLTPAGGRSRRQQGR